MVHPGDRRRRDARPSEHVSEENSFRHLSPGVTLFPTVCEPVTAQGPPVLRNEAGEETCDLSVGPPCPLRQRTHRPPWVLSQGSLCHLHTSRAPGRVCRARALCQVQGLRRARSDNVSGHGGPWEAGHLPGGQGSLPPSARGFPSPATLKAEELTLKGSGTSFVLCGWQ